jgi:hypothetical protein
MKTKYVCGAEIVFAGGKKVATYPMSICDTKEEAARENKKLHASFGYFIYEIDASKLIPVMSHAGMAASRPTKGFLVTADCGYSFDLLKQSGGF